MDYITGLDGNDNLFGLGTLLGGGGDDFLSTGRPRMPTSDDTLDGGPGTDWAYFGKESSGVTADLALDTASGELVGNDRILNIENVEGSNQFNDVIFGDDQNNILDGGAQGEDVLVGRGGDDVLSGHTGSDALDGGPGTDSLYGGASADRCVHGEVLSSCQS